MSTTPSFSIFQKYFNKYSQKKERKEEMTNLKNKQQRRGKNTKHYLIFKMNGTKFPSGNPST